MNSNIAHSVAGTGVDSSADGKKPPHGQLDRSGLTKIVGNIELAEKIYSTYTRFIVRLSGASTVAFGPISSIFVSLMQALSPYKLVLGLLLSCVTVMGNAQDLSAFWRLRVMDLKHQMKVDATIQFTKQTDVKSCMAGAWKRVLVKAKDAHDEDFFPLNEALAYEVNKGQFTLGRTEVCDGYLFLSGKMKGTDVRGTYDTVGLGGGRKIGYFSLTKIR